MALILNDTLQVTDGSGSYTLQIYLGGAWHDITTISGATNGTVEVNSSVNTIPVNRNAVTTGDTYQFRWIDGNGVESNIRSLEVPPPLLNHYAFGTASIDVTNTGGDSWSITFPYSFVNLNASSTLTGLTVQCVPYQSGAPLLSNPGYINHSGFTAPVTATFSGVGACVYFCYAVYSFSDGAALVLMRLWQSDGAGGIVRSISLEGFEAVSIDGMAVSATAVVNTTGTVTPVSGQTGIVTIGPGSGTTLLSSTSSISAATIPPDTTDIQYRFGLTTSEWTDLLVGGNPSTIGAIIDAAILIS